MKHTIIALLLSCLCITGSALAQPPANTYRERNIGRNTYYYNKTGQKIGSSYKAGNMSVYRNGHGATYSRGFQRGNTTIYQSNKGGSKK